MKTIDFTDFLLLFSKLAGDSPTRFLKVSMTCALLVLETVSK